MIDVLMAGLSQCACRPAIRRPRPLGKLRDQPLHSIQHVEEMGVFYLIVEILFVLVIPCGYAAWSDTVFKLDDDAPGRPDRHRKRIELIQLALVDEQR